MNQIENTVHVYILAVIPFVTKGSGWVNNLFVGQVSNSLNVSLKFTGCLSSTPLNLVLKCCFVLYSVAGSSWSWDRTGL